MKENEAMGSMYHKCERREMNKGILEGRLEEKWLLGKNAEIGAKIWSGYVDWISLAQGTDQW